MPDEQQPGLTLDRTRNDFRVALGADPDSWDAHLRETVEAAGATEVVAQYFVPMSDPTRSDVATFTTRTEALAWLQEQYAADHPAVSE